MDKYVLYKARGVIYDRDKNGKATGVKEIRYGSGVVKSGPEIMGRVFRQNTNLLPCDMVTVDEYNI